MRCFKLYMLGILLFMFFIFGTSICMDPKSRLPDSVASEPVIPTLRLLRHYERCDNLLDRIPPEVRETFHRECVMRKISGKVSAGAAEGLLGKEASAASSPLMDRPDSPPHS